MKLFLTMLAIVCAGFSHAVVLLSEDFDSMSAGTVAGQQSLVGPQAPATWGQTNFWGVATAPALVQSGAPQGVGGNVLAIAPTTTICHTVTRPDLPLYELQIGETWSMSVDLRMDPTTQTVSNVGVGLVNGGYSYASRLGYISFGGSQLSVPDTGKFVYAQWRDENGELTGGNLQIAPGTAFRYLANRWYNVALTQTRINATDSMIRYYIDGVQLLAWNSVPGSPTQYFPVEMLAPGVTHVLPTGLMASRGTSQGPSPQGYVDNLRVTSVPEPMTLCALGLGLAFLARRKAK